MNTQTHKMILPIAAGFLLASLAGCALIPDLPPAPTPTPALPASEYDPQPADAKLTRGQVFLELDNSRVVLQQSMPVQVSLILNGNLPTPCHQLRVVITPANAKREINLEVYSVYDPKAACIMVIQPISATIPLGSYAGGHYSVYVNGELAGEFDS